MRVKKVSPAERVNADLLERFHFVKETTSAAAVTQWRLVFARVRTCTDGSLQMGKLV